MEPLLRIGLSNAACAAGLAMVAWIMSRLVRRPAVIHALWVLVLIKLITPPIWSVPIHFGDYPAVTPQPIAPATDRRIVAPSANPPASFPAQVQVTPEPAARFPSLASAAVSLWVAGSVACAMLVILRVRRFGKMLQFATLGPPALQDQAREIGQAIGLRSVPSVWLLHGPICPMLWAAFGRSRLLLPGQLWDRLTRSQQSSLLAHELAHLRRRDHWVRLLELIVTPLFWWDPILWWARYELHIAEEECCDAWVAWAMPHQTDDYARALVEAVDFASNQAGVPLLASGVGEFRSLKRRLLMIQQGNNVRTLGVVGMVVIGAVGLVLPLMPGQAQTSREPAGSAAPDLKSPVSRPTTRAAEAATGEAFKKLRRPLPDVKLNQMRFDDAIQFLENASGVKFDVDWNALEAVGISRTAPVTIHGHGIDSITAMNRILAAAAPKQTLSWGVQNGVMKIALARNRTRQMQAFMDRTLPQVQFDKVGLADVFDFLRDVSGVNIIVDWKALEAAGINRNKPVSARLRNVSFSKALSTILDSAGGPRAKLGYRIDDSLLTISTAAQLSNPVVVQTYEISDLIKNDAGRVNQIVETIIDSIDTHSWKLHGGTVGDIREKGAQLIVTQTPPNQEAIANLLANLRELMKQGQAR